MHELSPDCALEHGAPRREVLFDQITGAKGRMGKLVVPRKLGRKSLKIRIVVGTKRFVSLPNHRGV